jgi:hypothetical protein
VLRKIIHRVAATKFIRAIMEERADLSAFKEKPTLRVIAGLFAIGFSYIIGWPAVAAFGLLSVRLEEPLIVVIGGSLAYGLSHLIFLLGMYLCGAFYSLIFFRWMIRVSMEKLLALVEKE